MLFNICFFLFLNYLIITATTFNFMSSNQFIANGRLMFAEEQNPEQKDDIFQNVQEPLSNLEDSNQNDLNSSPSVFKDLEYF